MKAEVNLNVQSKQPTPEDLEKKEERDRLEGGPRLRVGWSTGSDDKYPGNAVVIQTADIETTKGDIYGASETPIESAVEKCLVADDFQ